MRKLEEYYLVLEDADMSKVKALHRVVGEAKDCFLTNKTLQNVVLNRGCEMDAEERPQSYKELPFPAFNGKIASLCLTYAEMMIERATRHTLIRVSAPKIIVPGQEREIKIETVEGHDLDKIEWLQEQWMTKHEGRRKVKEYQGVLQKAIEEYAMQGLLIGLNHCCKNFFPLEWKEERAIQERLNKAWDEKAHNVLGSAYYNRGNTFFRSAGELWDELMEDDFGKMFVLTRDEIQQGLTQGLAI